MAALVATRSTLASFVLADQDTTNSIIDIKECSEIQANLYRSMTGRGSRTRGKSGEVCAGEQRKVEQSFWDSMSYKIHAGS